MSLLRFGVSLEGSGCLRYLLNMREVLGMQERTVERDQASTEAEDRCTRGSQLGGWKAGRAAGTGRRRWLCTGGC